MTNRARIMSLSAMVAALSMLFTSVAQAAPGDLDGTFGSGGKLVTDFKNLRDEALAVAVQPDGKLVAAGFAETTDDTEGGGFDFGLARYNSDGTLDPTFGRRGAGKVTTHFSDSRDFAEALVIQPNGRMVAAGVANGQFALARYTTNGVLDRSFGVGGKVTTAFGLDAEASALVLQPDGKLVAAGSVDGDFALARFLSNGLLDPSFGSGGLATTEFDADRDSVSALVLQPDGKLVAAGTARIGGVYGNNLFALARYSPDGTLDSTFGIGGKVTTEFGFFASGADDGIRALVLQPDGELIAAGAALVSDDPEVPLDWDFAIARYDATGGLDDTFGNGGKVTTPFGTEFDGVHALLAQPNGMLIAGGVMFGNPFLDMALARYNFDGTLDSSFGSGGKVVTSVCGSGGQINALALQAGKPVAAGGAGACSFNNPTDFALVRYLS